MTHYLLEHKNAAWSWNYWERGSSARPYPDDLDDTACAIAGIAGYDPSRLDASAQACVAKNLIACEVKPGGPYATWLMPADDTQWRDVDPAVNANIGFMLQQLGVHSAELQAYVDECLVTHQLESPYYVGEVPTLYFMARWYKGDQSQRLINLVAERLRQPNLGVLELALLVTAACNLGQWDLVTPRQIRKLLDQQRQGGWPMQALYYEPPQNGVWRHAGSAELTTAFMLEALASWQGSQLPELSVPEPPSTLADAYKALLVTQNKPEIITIAGTVARAGGWNIKESTIRHLNRGSRNGWLAYTIYDDFLDEEGDPKLLSVANLAMRKSLLHFAEAIPGQYFKHFVENVFTQVDAANAWEVLHARNPESLPEYGMYAKLAQRSWGHVIAPTGVLLAAGFALESPEVQQLHDFFRHYSIAKQFCDDAHDWLDDLRNNRITPVVALLLKDCPERDDVSRQLYFWEETIDRVNTIIREHLDRAQKVLHACHFLAVKIDFQQWLDGLEAACLQAEQDRQAARQFIQTFSTPSLVN